MTPQESASFRLAVYGSLRPGGSNHHVVADLDGWWTSGTVRGELLDHGWGSYRGYLGIVLDPDGPEVPVEVLESQALVNNWQRLDDFEGPGYQRTTTIVSTADDELSASIYELSVRSRGLTD